MQSSVHELSIVIPAYNESGNIQKLINEIRDALATITPVPDYEIIVVDDCSSDDTLAEIKESMAEHPQLRVFKHENRGGKSAALRSGFREVKGRWVVTLDGDGQNDPNDIAKYWDQVSSGPYDTIYAGVRRMRNDGMIKMMTSKFANRFRRMMLNDDTRDTGCGFKILPQPLLQNLAYFDNMHRFFPALAKLNGYGVTELSINDRPREHGISKYGFFDRASVAFLDVIGVFWLNQRKYRAGNVTQIEPRHGSAEVHTSRSQNQQLGA